MPTLSSSRWTTSDQKTPYQTRGHARVAHRKKRLAGFKRSGVKQQIGIIDRLFIVLQWSNSRSLPPKRGKSLTFIKATFTLIQPRSLTRLRSTAHISRESADHSRLANGDLLMADASVDIHSHRECRGDRWFGRSRRNRRIAYDASTRRQGRACGWVHRIPAIPPGSSPMHWYV